MKPRGRTPLTSPDDILAMSVMIDGNTELIAHIGYPTYTFRSPRIYNPYFRAKGINAVVVPMGCRAGDYPAFLVSVFRLTNIRGALITMPHKMTTVDLLDEASTAVRVAGACNAVRRLDDGRLQGDLFDGTGFVNGIRRKGFAPQGASVLIVGCGGVGSAIAASLAACGVERLALFDVDSTLAQGLARRLSEHFPGVRLATGSRDPLPHDLVVNATPLGMQDTDPLPLDVQRIRPDAWVGDVVLKAGLTPLLVAAQARGCKVQVGADMLLEQIPAYLEYFGYPGSTPDELRLIAGEPD